MELATKAGLDAGYQEVVDWARTAHGIEFRERAHTAAPDTPLRVAGPHHLWYDTPAGSSDRNA